MAQNNFSQRMGLLSCRTILGFKQNDQGRTKISPAQDLKEPCLWAKFSAIAFWVLVPLSAPRPQPQGRNFQVYLCR